MSSSNILVHDRRCRARVAERSRQGTQLANKYVYRYCPTPAFYHTAHSRVLEIHRIQALAEAVQPVELCRPTRQLFSSRDVRISDGSLRRKGWVALFSRMSLPRLSMHHAAGQ